MAGNSSSPGTSVTSRVLALLGSFDDDHRGLTLSQLARRAGLDFSRRGDQPGRGVGRPDRDPVTLADAELGESTGGAPNPLRQFDIAESQ